jgi:NADH pyrophosphatase NudC (nudix superfamily)
MNYKSFNLGDWIGHISGVIEDETTLDGNEMRDLVEFLSTLKQEPKTGHWKYGYAFADGNYCKCSECKEIIKCTYPMHYCPNCGAKMVEPQESEDKE